MRHLSRPGHRHPLYVTDPDSGRRFAVPQGGDENDGGVEGGEGSGDGGDGGEGGGGDSSGDGSGDGDGQSEDKKLTQAEVDAILAKRLKDERGKWERDAKEKAEREKMDEVERLKAEKADADKAREAATEAANARLVAAEAKVAAVAAGAKADQAAYVVKLADLTGVEVSDDGEPDSDAIKKAVTKVLTDVPALKAEAGKGGPSGGPIGGEQPPTKAASIEDAVNAKYAAQAK